MDFALSIDDDEAAVKAPNLRRGSSVLSIERDAITVRLGEELAFSTPLRSVQRAQLLPDPRPHIFLPLGVSAAAQQYGAETLCAIGSYEGLVRIDFTRTVEAEVRPPDLSMRQTEAPSSATVGFSHLILSLEDPEACVAVLNGSNGIASGPDPL